MERAVDRSIRIKVTNDCQWTCTFCHNEGTELPGSSNRINRVSVFLDPRVRQLPAVEDIVVDNTPPDWIDPVKKLGIDEVHLTGGEPTLHPYLPKLIKILTNEGMSVKMTTNGQASPNRMNEMVKAGLKGVIFSILSLDPVEFLKTQNPPVILGLSPIKWAQRMIEKEMANILLVRDLGIDVKINTVVLGKDDYSRVDGIRKFATQHSISLVLLPSVGDQEISQDAVFEYANTHAQFLHLSEKTNSSNSSRQYYMTDDTRLSAKYLRPYHPEIVCGSCEYNSKATCMERFYGLRMEFRAGEPYIRLCVQQTNDQTVMPLRDFIKRDIYSQL